MPASYADNIFTQSGGTAILLTNARIIALYRVDCNDIHKFVIVSLATPTAMLASPAVSDCQDGVFGRDNGRPCSRRERAATPAVVIEFPLKRRFTEVGVEKAFHSFYCTLSVNEYQSEPFHELASTPDTDAFVALGMVNKRVVVRFSRRATGDEKSIPWNMVNKHPDIVISLQVEVDVRPLSW
ncbi:MAG: hypothetical protein LC104_01280 [Bacteroidales bacterium]|nr:hypothetical protein [Bacteroidales bacterium]